jgi:hypothetical protein
MIVRLALILLLACCSDCRAQYAPAAQEQVVYRNPAYDFCFTLPAGWSGFSIVTRNWNGEWIGDAARPASAHDLEGPKILIRHPKWTESAPREDIPIMVFSLAQWKLVAAEEVSVSAAPIGPTELGRNAKFVFALPPRYSFDEREGVDEVVDLMSRHPLRAPCPAAESH